MYQPYPSAGPPAAPLRPAAPAPTLTAAKFMFGGAAYLIAALPFIGDIHGRFFGPRVTSTPLGVTLVVVIFGLAVVWLLWRPARSAFFKPQRFV